MWLDVEEVLSVGADDAPGSFFGQDTGTQRGDGQAGVRLGGQFHLLAAL